jgi:hypothetical protein
MRFLLLVLMMFAVGCSGPTQTYQVTLRNDLTQPITVWLTKSGPPAEANWLSPEQVAVGEGPPGGRMAGTAVPSGKTAETPKISGKLPAGTSAILRVYVGQHTLDELLAMSRGNSNRLDVPLSPGDSNLIVRERDGKLVAEQSPEKL